MKRKLCSMLLSAFALFLLMGASLERSSAVALMVEDGVSAETSGMGGQDADQLAAVSGTALSEAVVIEEDRTLLLDGKAVSLDTKKVIVEGVTYVALKGMSLEFDSSAVVSWNGNNATVTITTDKLSLSAVEGQKYIIANGRYLFIPGGVQVVDGTVMVPLNTLAKAFDAQVDWDAETSVISVSSGSGALERGENFYVEDDLFWLSRVIFAESGNQPLEGKMGVGIVVLNRVKSPIYPDTILGVLQQRNQFTTYGNGRLANRTPNEQSVIAAKLVLDGGIVEEVKDAIYFDSANSSWASRNRTCVAVIGNHKFYI